MNTDRLSHMHTSIQVRCAVKHELHLKKSIDKKLARLAKINGPLYLHLLSKANKLAITHDDLELKRAFLEMSLEALEYRRIQSDTHDLQKILEGISS